MHYGRNWSEAELMAALRNANMRGFPDFTQTAQRARPEAKTKSRFDGPNVIDLVRGADGTYSVPEAHLRDVRAL